MRAKKIFITTLIIAFLCSGLNVYACGIYTKDVSDTPIGKEAKTSIRESGVMYTMDDFTNAVLCNNQGLVNQIINSNILNINSKDSEGQYPLEMTLIFTNCDMAKILLEAGADPYVVTLEGKTIYDLAMETSSRYFKSIFRKYQK